MSGRKQKFKVDFNALSCWGGAVVIIGSLFKILHLKGASVMISAGLGTEAVLFFLSGFIPPHKDPDWSRVYPAIDDDYYNKYLKDTDPVPMVHHKVTAEEEEALKNAKKTKIKPPVVDKKALKAKHDEEHQHALHMELPPQPIPAHHVVGHGGHHGESEHHVKNNGVSNAVQTASAISNVSADVSSETMKQLEVGLKNFGEKVANISAVVDTTVATNEFSNKMKSVSDDLGLMSATFKQASSQVSDLASATGVGVVEYKEQVVSMAKNLAAINAMYELELQESSAHLRSMTGFYQGMATSMQSLNDAVVDSKVFKEEVSKLARNLSSLNAVYGNMLTTVNQPRQ